MQTEQKILEDAIKYHNGKYWGENDPEISDQEYDKLCRQLAEIVPDHSLLKEVHASSGANKTFKHTKKMLSLAKAYTKAEIITWAESVSRGNYELFRIGPKLDGCASEVGLNYIATRGDGEVGELVTDKRPIIGHLPEEGFPVRGEIVVCKIDLTLVAREDGTPYKTCRSAAAGLLNQKKPLEMKGRNLPLTFIPHSASLGEFGLKQLQELDFDTLMSQEANKAYPVDGLVVSLVDQDYAESLGMTGHHPRHSIAYKMKNPETVSKVIGVEWQVSKTRIAPVAILEPTELDGITIERATLHNLQQIARLGVMIGSQVKLVRAGSVIPAITEVISNKGASVIQIPFECPACGTELSNDGQDVVCNNEHCGGTLACKLRDSLVRLGVENIGPQIASDLVAAGYKDYLAVFGMTNYDWERLPGFATASAVKMFKQFNQLKLTPIEDYKILAAMVIEGVGVTVSKRLCSAGLFTDPTLDLESIPGVGRLTADKIKAGFSHHDYAKASAMFSIISTTGLADRKSCCFTGKSDTPRSEWIKIAEKKGYVYKGAVTKDLDLLVLADLESTSSKAIKAGKYGVKMISYEEFENG